MRPATWIAFAMAVACGGGQTGSNHFAATLSAANEAPNNGSPATGTADYVLTGDGVVYTITYANLSGPPGASHIHVGAAGINGPVVVPFSGLPTGTSGTFSGTFTTTGVKAGTSGTTTISAGNLDDILNAFRSGNAYTNIHTTANPGGEIRGQVTPK